MISFRISQPFSLRLTSLILSQIQTRYLSSSRLVRHNDLRLQHQPEFINSLIEKAVDLRDTFILDMVHQFELKVSYFTSLHHINNTTVLAYA